ncbi:MAG: molybdopterin-synthase adenylyltransferase MoeB [Anaerolineae bacterium]|nr:molybdopterin-synthase adenylyltransferase MoeB [Anaerolineae bacterium]
MSHNSIVNGRAEAVALSQEEVKRYSRHLIMPEVGMAGQKKLKAASVLIVGAGGLGSPLALYLAAAGIGRIGIIDYDTVDHTNLQRQILYTTDDLGKSKIEIARQRIQAANPNVQVDLYNEPLTSANALRLFAPYDLIIDGTDNFPTRYLVNDACVLLGKPNVYGSIFRFEGQVTVFNTEDGPCYRCLYPEPPPPGLVPSCAEGGVLGVLPGIVGTMQALEAIKLITGIGTPLKGRLLLFDALHMEFTELKLRKNPNCVVCGPNPTVTALIDYEQFCGVPAHDHSTYSAEPEPVPGGTLALATEVRQLSPADLKARLDNGDNLVILDVREPHEWDISNLSEYGALLIPKGDVLNRVAELDRSAEIVVQCRSGGRSAAVIRQLQPLGFDNLWNLDGGINRWAEEIDPSKPLY